MLCYISKEMIYPILPLYLTTVLGTTPQIVGLIEGISKSLASIIKFYSGYFSDKIQNKKILVIIGYLGALFHKILLVFASSWLIVLFAKIIERFGKGIRIAPRDAIIADASKDNTRGKNFGIQRFFDKLGAVIGILIAFILITNTKNHAFQLIFLISIIPVLIGIILLLFLKQDKYRGIIDINFKKLNNKLQIFFSISFISSIGNSTKSFLLLKAAVLGFNPSAVILLYLISNLATCIISLPIGKLFDKLSKRKLISLAYFLFGITYLGIGLFKNHTIIIILFIMYGVYISLISVGAKAFIVDEAPLDMRATALGINECLIGLASLPAAIIGGLLWNLFGSSASFYFSSILGFISALIMIILIKEKKI